MRGAPRAALVPSGYSGIIPAYAGSTPSRETWAAARTDHPRVCGEHLGESVGIGGLVGSSPRMRGARVLVGGDGGLVGIIPAYAGSTGADHADVTACGDHPRVCGEHTSRPWSWWSWWGSSPRMRGALYEVGKARKDVGIIPAYAGSTFRGHESAVQTRDHPRVCGEHLAYLFPC